MKEIMRLIISPEDAENRLKQRICSGRSLLGLCYTAQTADRLFGDIRSSRFWLMPYRGDGTVHFSILPKRFFFGEIDRDGGETVISGSFRFPCYYLFILAFFLLASLIPTALRGGSNMTDFLIVDAALSILAYLLILLYGRVANKSSEKRMISILRGIFYDCELKQ